MSAAHPFRFTIGAVTIAHIMAVSLLLIAGANSCAHRKPPPDMLPVEILVAVDNGPEVREPIKPDNPPPPPIVKPPPPKPAPELEPEPEPAVVVPEVIKKPVKKPPEPVKKPPEPVKKPPEPVKKPPAVVKKPAEPTKKPIELGRRITAPNNNPPDPNRKRLSDEEIARRLALGATPSNRDLMPEGDALDFEVIRRRLYKAWAQPGSASSRISAEVEIRLNPSGTIIGRRLLRPSGNPVMDKSVMEAVQSVFRIDGLNPGFVDRKGGRVTITFEVNAGAA